MKNANGERTKRNDYVIKFRKAVHFEMENDFKSAMISWAIAELAAPTKKEAKRCRDRKIACLKKLNNLIKNSTFSSSDNENHKHVKDDYHK